jgi:hypothetical protein
MNKIKHVIGVSLALLLGFTSFAQQTPSASTAMQITCPFRVRETIFPETRVCLGDPGLFSDSGG